MSIIASFIYEVAFKIILLLYIFWIYIAFYEMHRISWIFFSKNILPVYKSFWDDSLLVKAILFAPGSTFLVPSCPVHTRIYLPGAKLSCTHQDLPSWCQALLYTPGSNFLASTCPLRTRIWLPWSFHQDFYIQVQLYMSISTVENLMKMVIKFQNCSVVWLRICTVYNKYTCLSKGCCFVLNTPENAK